MPATTGPATTVTLGTGDTEIIAAVAGDGHRLFFIISNTDTAARTFRFHVYDGAGAAAQTNAIFFDRALAAGETISIDFGLADNEKVSGQASVASVVNVRTWELTSSR